MIRGMDSFDHYGSDINDGGVVADAPNRMVDGPYAATEGIQITAGGVNSHGYSNPYGIPVRTGPFHCFLSGNNLGIRRTYDGNFQVAGFGGAYHFHQMPAGTSQFTLMSFRDANNRTQIALGLDTTGAFVVYRDSDDSGGNIIYTSSQPDVVTGAFQHIEARIDCDAALGAFEVRVNGVTKVNLTGINTRPRTDASGGTGRVSQIRVGTNNSGNPGFAIDDIVLWAVTGVMGEANTDFIGDRKVYTLFPDADTSVADYTAVGAADGFNCINDVHTDSDGNVDDDSSYIRFDSPVGSVPDLGDFTFTNLPAEVVVVTAIETYVRSKKTDAGTADQQVSLLAEGDVADGADRPITTAYTYWMDIFELNPHTGSPFLPSEVNAAGLRIARTD